MTVEQLIYYQFDFVQCPLECVVGWHELIYNMCVEIDDMWFEVGEATDLSILQIKEKWGKLVVYHNSFYKCFDFIIDRYAELSKSTCEICGAEGKLIRDGYWVMVRCEGCSI